MTGTEALTFLKAGNLRYIKGDLKHPNTDLSRRQSLKTAQNPFAVILSCADSRVIPELIFDQGLGDLFVIRVAGNVVEKSILGSIEYAISHLNTKLIIVLGHQNCGAVKASMNGSVPCGHIGEIVQKIKPAVKMAKSMEGNHFENSIRTNAKMTSDQIKVLSPVLSQAYENEGLIIASAYYSLETGVVEFM